MVARDILEFPTGEIPELSRSRIVGAAVESSGHSEKGHPHTLILEHGRRIYILLSKIEEDDHSKNIQRLSPSWIPVEERAFAVEKNPLQYQSIGREVGWTRGMQISGELFVDDIREVPWRMIFENTELPAHATVVISTLRKNTQLHLPPDVFLDPTTEYYLSGMSIRVTDTFPGKPPGGGKRMVA